MSVIILSRLRRFRGSKLWHMSRRKRLFIDCAVMITILVTMALVTNVPTRVEKADAAVFLRVVGLTPQIRPPKAFDDQIVVIREIQGKILKLVPHNLGIPPFESREPENMFRLGHGLCYDRSRSIEKALKHVGFRTRHVYVLYRTGKSFLPALLTYRQPSHAVTEVLTGRGWMLVDSNHPWIALTKNNLPVPADQVWRRTAEFASLSEGMDEPSWVIRGMYSRKGFFYKPFLPFPEISWPDFVLALFD